MREPSILKTAAVSLLVHLTLLVFSVVLLQYSRNVVMPSPYTVSLVNPENAGRPGPPVSRSRAVESRVSETEEPVKESTTTIDTTKKDDQKRIDDRMTELASKKKVENIVKLRSVISVKGSSIKSSARPSAKEEAPAGGSKATLVDNYYGKITEEIRQEWVYPDMGKKGLQAVVSVLIRRDGTITVQGIEKSSGDLLFDRSALKAVLKASPVSPPPYEMEIGINFYP
jgi:colicin import membrane protein